MFAVSGLMGIEVKGIVEEKYSINGTGTMEVWM